MEGEAGQLGRRRERRREQDLGPERELQLEPDLGLDLRQEARKALWRARTPRGGEMESAGW